MKGILNIHLDMAESQIIHYPVHLIPVMNNPGASLNSPLDCSPPHFGEGRGIRTASLHGGT